VTSNAGTYEYAPTTRTKLNTLLGTPWRYRCPECDCTTVVVRDRRGDENEHREVYEDNTVRGPTVPHVHDFLCSECRVTFDEPYDAKEDECHPIHDV